MRGCMLFQCPHKLCLTFSKRNFWYIHWSTHLVSTLLQITTISLYFKFLNTLPACNKSLYIFHRNTPESFFIFDEFVEISGKCAKQDAFTFRIEPFDCASPYLCYYRCGIDAWRGMRTTVWVWWRDVFWMYLRGFIQTLVFTQACLWRWTLDDLRR